PVFPRSGCARPAGLAGSAPRLLHFQLFGRTGLRPTRGGRTRSGHAGSVHVRTTRTRPRSRAVLLLPGASLAVVEQARRDTGGRHRDTPTGLPRTRPGRLSTATVGTHAVQRERTVTQLRENRAVGVEHGFHSGTVSAVHARHTRHQRLGRRAHRSRRSTARHRFRHPTGTRRVGLSSEPVRGGDRTGCRIPEVVGRVVAGEPDTTTRRRRTSGEYGRIAARGL